MGEKSLIKIENKTIFQKIKLFFKKLFLKDEKQKLDQVDTANKNSINIIDELGIKQEVIQLQQQYESGLIYENDLTDSQKEKLITLYKEQINNLEKRVIENKKILNNYKTKILDIKNNI